MDKESKTKESKTKEECPGCHGTGEISGRYDPVKNKTYYVTCYVCNGTGLWKI
jgi:DnaJ-class molecular chaperone